MLQNIILQKKKMKVIYAKIFIIRVPIGILHTDGTALTLKQKKGSIAGRSYYWICSYSTIVSL